MDNKPVLGILLGDATGVGPEIVAKLAVSGFLTEHCKPILIGDERVLQKALALVGGKAVYHTARDVAELDFSKADLQMLDLHNVDPDKVAYGELSAYSGKAVNDTLVFACKLCKEGKIEGFAFAPFNKSAMIQGGCAFESEHHLIAHEFQWTEPCGEVNVLNDLWTTRTTSHIPLKDVSASLTKERILRALRLAHTTLVNAGIPKPMIGVAALNPHGGEHGHCGREEIDVIAPAVEEANQKLGINAQGPYPSDTVFIKAFRGDFNAVVTMFHDQGQIALKLAGFDYGITIAGGFPYPIATCAHGTAYDIAGKGVVKTTALENAVKMVARMSIAKRARGQ